MTDLSVYQPPGVYVSDASLPYADAINPVLTNRVMCLVGPALGYQGATDRISLYSATATALSHPGVLQDSTLLVKTISGTTLVLNTDYSVTVDSSDPDAPITSLTRLPSSEATASPGGLAEGDGVVVSYNYADSQYYQPHAFSDFSSLAAMYGQPLDDTVGSTTPVLSPLTLAAQVAFENGASQIITVAVKGGTGTSTTVWQSNFTDAYAKVATNPSVDLIVPIFPDVLATTGSNYNSLLIDLRGHVDTAYSNGYARMGIVGASAGFNETTTPYEQSAEAAHDKRIVATYPTRVTMYNPASAQTIEIGGGYVAAAVAGRLMLNDVDRGVTRQVLNSITGIPGTVAQKMSKSFMDNLASRGVCVTMLDRNGRVSVRHGVTTDTTSLVTREISIVRIGDTLLQDVQVALDASGLIGSPITLDTTVAVQSILVGALEQEISNQVILSYAAVTVTQQALPTGDPSVIDCRFAYRPAAPLNYITVEFTLDLSAGTVTPANTDTTSAGSSTPPAAN